MRTSQTCQFVFAEKFRGALGAPALNGLIPFSSPSLYSECTTRHNPPKTGACPACCTLPLIFRPCLGPTQHVSCVPNLAAPDQFPQVHNSPVTLPSLRQSPEAPVVLEAPICCRHSTEVLTSAELRTPDTEKSETSAVPEHSLHGQSPNNQFHVTRDVPDVMKNISQMQSFATASTALSCNTSRISQSRPSYRLAGVGVVAFSIQ